MGATIQCWYKEVDNATGITLQYCEFEMHVKLPPIGLTENPTTTENPMPLVAFNDTHDNNT